MLDDRVGAAEAADVLGGECVADHIIALGGLGGGINIVLDLSSQFLRASPFNETGL